MYMENIEFDPEEREEKEEPDKLPYIRLNQKELPETPEVIHLSGPDEKISTGESAKDLTLQPIIPEAFVDLPVETFSTNSSETIRFKDLPIIWQRHIIKRKVDNFLPIDKNIFTKAEILEATANEKSWTDPLVVDKVFTRAKKERIPFSVLPPKWQEILRKKHSQEIDTFDDITIEILVKNGATEKDLETLKKRALGQNRIRELEAELFLNDIQKNSPLTTPEEIKTKIEPNFKAKTLFTEERTKKPSF